MSDHPDSPNCLNCIQDMPIDDFRLSEDFEIPEDYNLIMKRVIRTLLGKRAVWRKRKK